MTTENAVSAQQRRKFVDAALTELALVGVDRFSIDRVARRVGVDPEVITAIWHDRRVLLMDAVLSRAREHVPVPDTGSLRGDLTEYVRASLKRPIDGVSELLLAAVAATLAWRTVLLAPQVLRDTPALRSQWQADSA